jgi:hypothetical protein
MEARNITAELKVFREVGMLHLWRSVSAERNNSPRSDDLRRPRQPVLRLSWDFRLFEYLVERASTALAKRIKGDARPPTAARINPYETRGCHLKERTRSLNPDEARPFIAPGPHEMRIAIIFSPGNQRYSSPQSPISCNRLRDFASTVSIFASSSPSVSKPNTRALSSRCCATPRRVPTMTPATAGRSRI